MKSSAKLKRTQKTKADSGKAVKAMPPPRTIARVVDGFVLEIDSLASTLPLAMKSITQARKDASAEFTRFLQEHGKPVRGSTTIQVDTTNASGAQKRWRDLNRTSAAELLVPRSFLVSLISQYDSFLGQLIETILLAKPEILHGSEKTLSFLELFSFDSIEAARQHVLEREIESVLRESHAEQFEWLERKFQIQLRLGLEKWPNFIEIAERRNLFVHTGGQVSAQYLKVCRTHKYDCGATAKGDRLGVRSDYFVKAHATVFEIGVKLAHVLWRKLMPDQREQADQNLVLISYNLLVQENYDLSKAILDFATDVLKTWSSSDMRLRFVVNRAQAYKWSGDNVRAMEILDKEDFSALSDGFKLAAAVLREDYKNALEVVRTMGAHGDVSLEDYREWPLFKEFRKQKELEPIIKKIFKEPLNKVNVDREASTQTGVKLTPILNSASTDSLSSDQNSESPRKPISRKDIN